MNINARYLSRKFLLATGTAVAGVVFFALGKMAADQWIAQSGFVLASYLAGNVGQKAVDKAKAS